MAVKIAPSILGANFCNLEKDIKILEQNSISVIHIDVMDGNFVPNIAFGVDQIKMLRTISQDLEFDVHLMVMNADMLIGQLATAGANTVTVHAESCLHLYRTINTIKSLGLKAGVALNPATPLDAIKYVAPLLDKVLIMTVEPGFGGQKFISSMLEKVKELKNMQISQNWQFDIQVDGGIVLSNVSSVVEYGANDIVIGSSIFSKNAIAENLKEFYAIITGK